MARFNCPQCFSIQDRPPGQPSGSVTCRVCGRESPSPPEMPSAHELLAVTGVCSRCGVAITTNDGSGCMARCPLCGGDVSG